MIFNSLPLTTHINMPAENASISKSHVPAVPWRRSVASWKSLMVIAVIWSTYRPCSSYMPACECQSIHVRSQINIWMSVAPRTLIDSFDNCVKIGSDYIGTVYFVPTVYTIHKTVTIHINQQSVPSFPDSPLRSKCTTTDLGVMKPVRRISVLSVLNTCRRSRYLVFRALKGGSISLAVKSMQPEIFVSFSAMGAGLKSLYFDRRRKALLSYASNGDVDSVYDIYSNCS